MDIQAPFGFVTGCHAADKFMVHATLASIRHYCPDVPICLIQDGDFDISDLRDLYSLIILRPQDLVDPGMRALTSGNYRAKLAAMWEGPFESYVWLDSDAILWGDFRHQLDLNCDFQIFWSEISVLEDAAEVPSWLPHFYFDPEQIALLNQNFQWKGLAYFCTGAFFSRRNSIPFEVWMEAEGWLKQRPSMFAWGEMGMLNYLVHALSQTGQLKVCMADLQHIPGHHGTNELKQDCPGNGWYFPPTIQRPRVAHFCGRKPFLLDLKAYSKPFTIARLSHYRRKGLSILLSLLYIFGEDMAVFFNKILMRCKRIIRLHR